MITIIPAMDIIAGQCVRLSRGDYATAKIYSRDPVEMAKRFEEHGLRRLHLVDLDGARTGQIVHHEILRRVAEATTLTIDFGGGLRRAEDVELALNSGAKQVTAGSIAVRQPQTVLEWASRFGRECIILGADFRVGHIAISGWSETSAAGLNDLIAFYYQQGIRQCICTDVERDGMLQGPALETYVEIKSRFPGLCLIASGGISGIEEVAALEAAGIDGVIIGKALYEGRITLEELTPYVA